MIFSLTIQNPRYTTRFINNCVFFLAYPQILAAPLTHRCVYREFYRKPRAWKQRNIAPAGNALLAVPESNERTSTVPMIPDRMRIDRAVNTFSFHCGKCVGQYFVSRATRSHLPH